MSLKTPLWSLIGSLAAVILGAVGGIFAPDLFSSTAIIGQLFLNALTFVLIPLIIAVSIQSVFAFGDVSKSTRTVGLTVLYFLGTAVAAVIIAVGVCLVTSPGAGIITEGVTPPRHASLREGNQPHPSSQPAGAGQSDCLHSAGTIFWAYHPRDADWRRPYERWSTWDECRRLFPGFVRSAFSPGGIADFYCSDRTFVFDRCGLRR